MTDLYIAQLPTGTIDNIQAVLPIEIGMPSSPQTIQVSIAQLKSTIFAGFIGENSAQLTYVTGTSYRVGSGTAEVNGEFLTWTAPITRSGLTFTSGTINYVYLYSSAGSAAVEESTTEPVFDTALNYYKKTGDASRRCIGFLQASTTNTIRMFVSNVKGRIAEFWYVDGDATSGVKNPISPNNSFATGTVWGEVDITNSVPVHTVDVLIVVKNIYAGSTDEAVVALSPWDMGTGFFGPFQVRARTNNAASNAFFGNTWMTLISPRKFWYKILTISGNPRLTIEVHGARITR